MTRDGRIGVIQAVGAAGFFSTGAILVRFAQDLRPVEVTSLRLLLGGLFVAAAAWASGDRVRLSGAEFRRLFPIGLIAAAHFLAFIASPYFTTVAHCLTLTYTASLFIAALPRAFLWERLPRRALIGMIVGLAGVAVLAGFEPHVTRRMLTGDLLALAAMALLPSALGHTLYNAALRRLHPSLPNLIATQEVPGGSLLAWLLPREVPPRNALAGAAITLIGVGLVLL